MEFLVEEGKQLNEACSTLILPALSIGNVGQLATDLLISSLRAERIGYFDDPNVLPCVGNNAYSPSPPGDLALSLEAYDSSANALTLIQQRSPVVKGMMVEFAKNLSNFASENGKKHVIILSSLDFKCWQNIDLSSGFQIYYLSSSNRDGTDEDCEALGWKRLEKYDPAQRRYAYLRSTVENNVNPEDDFPFEELEEEDYYPSLPFAALFSCFKIQGNIFLFIHSNDLYTATVSRGQQSGLSWLLKSLAKGIKVTCLFCYCSEGDNTPDAFHLAEATSKLLKMNPESYQGNESRWTIPFSWMSVYGPPPDTSIF